MKSALKKILLIASVLTAAVVLSPSPAFAATTQYGCTFSVPKPAISGGKASFKLTVKCTNTVKPYNRQVVVDLMADDAVIDDTLQWTAVSTPNITTYTISRSGWKCQEDAVGNDEIYLRAHMEKGKAGNVGWNKGAWVNGAAVSGNCY